MPVLLLVSDYVESISRDNSNL